METRIEYNMEPENLLRYCEGKCTPDECKQIEEAIKTSEELRDIIHNLEISLALKSDINAMEAIDARSAYERTRLSIKKKRMQRWNTMLVRYAAVLTIPLLFTSLIFCYLYFKSSPNEMLYAEVNTASGAIIRYELPDKSVVWLNSGSKLRYPIRFKEDKREVELDGEGYFEVTSDKEHPFYVNTPSGLSIYVYGTHFNVNAYHDDKYVETVLEEGRVNVLNPQKTERLVLKPGESALYDGATNALSKREIDVYEKTAWKDGKLIFRNTSLKDVLKRLARHFNVDIEFNNLSGKEYKYRATFTSEDLDQILNYLSKSAAIKWKSEEAIQQADATFTKKKVIVTLY